MAKQYIAIIFLSAMLTLALACVAPQQYTKGYADGYQARINYEHGK